MGPPPRLLPRTGAAIDVELLERLAHPRGEAILELAAGTGVGGFAAAVSSDQAAG